MTRTGQHFEVVLKDAHLGWGKKGNSRSTVNRSEFEVYLPINSDNARTFDIKATEVFEAVSDDGYYSHNLKASGSQGPGNQYAKNFQSEGDLRKLGYWLKERRNAQTGDRIKVEFLGEHSVKLTHYPT